MNFLENYFDKLPIELQNMIINKMYIIPKNLYHENNVVGFTSEYIKNNKEFVSKREEILSMIWDMEEEIMGKEN